MSESSADAPKSVYRFRPMGRLLGGELQNQQIYFAPPAKLNDPMEGYYDVFWKGDNIVWKNLFKNYLLCLHHVYVCIRVGQESFAADDIPIFLTHGRLPTQQYQELMSSIFSRFFSNRAVTDLIKLLSTGRREVRRDELLLYLRSVHVYALSIIADAGGAPLSSEINPEKSLEGLQVITSALDDLPTIKGNSDGDGQAAESIMFEVISSFSVQQELARLSENPSLPEDAKKSFILLEFPRHYVNRLEQLAFPPWYTACFVGEIHNAAVWAHYGDQHTGACLKFRTTPLKESGIGLRLEHIKGYSSGRDGTVTKVRGFDVLQLERVIYDERYPSLDFFQSLGRLPRGDLLKHWYGDESGAQSDCGAAFRTNEAEWKDRYWKSFHKSKTIKLPEWAYERERRIVLSSVLSDLNDPADRLLRFDFRDLEEIIFGARASAKDKLEVIQMVDAACQKFKHFQIRLSQATYSHTSGRFEIHHLPLLKFTAGAAAS